MQLVLWILLAFLGFWILRRIVKGVTKARRRARHASAYEVRPPKPTIPPARERQEPRLTRWPQEYGR